MRRTGFVYDERCELHDNGSMLLDARAQRWLDVPHAENAERLTRTYQVLERSGVLEDLARVPAREATVEELGLVHPASHIELIRRASERGELEWVGPEARVSAASWTASALAAGGIAEAADRVLAGELDNAFCAAAPARPPRLERSGDGLLPLQQRRGRRAAAQRAHGLERVAIVDWDVHHGNGTQDDLLRRPLRPLRLAAPGRRSTRAPAGERRGAGAGAGATVNVRLPAGTGDDGYLHAFERGRRAGARARSVPTSSSSRPAGRARDRPARPDARDDEGFVR